MVSSSFMKIPGILCFVFTTWQWCDLLEQFSLDGLYSSPPSPLSSSELQKNCENDGFTLSPLSYLTSRSNTFSVIQKWRALPLNSGCTCFVLFFLYSLSIWRRLTVHKWGLMQKVPMSCQGLPNYMHLQGSFSSYSTYIISVPTLLSFHPLFFFCLRFHLLCFHTSSLTRL